MSSIEAPFDFLAVVPKAETAECRGCSSRFDESSFSSRQWRKRASETDIKCRTCFALEHRERGRNESEAAFQEQSRSASGVRLHPQNHGYSNYVDQLMARHSFVEIAALGLFPSAKDISESMAVLHATAAFAVGGDLRVAWRSERVLALAIGDGTTPRTAATACFLTKWDAISIDPLLGDDWTGAEPKGVRRLRGVKGTLDEFMASDLPARDLAYEHVVLLCVHSHARFVGASAMPLLQRKFGGAPTTLVALPCCNTFHPDKDVGSKPQVEYDDVCVFSAKRKIKVWNFPRLVPVA